MNTVVRRKLEMVARVREFCRVHSATEPGYAPVLAKLEESLARAQVIVAREHEGRTAARGARAHREELRRVVHFQLLRYLVAVGSAAAKDRAELAERFKLPSTNASNASFLTSVKALLATAEGQKELLVKEGMKESVLADLTRMISDMEVALETMRTGRRDHMGARADLEATTNDLLGQVKVLDGITGYRFGVDPEMIAEWNAVRHIPGQPSRRKPAGPGDEGGTVREPAPGDQSGPSESGGVAPAA
jgi:hypothetical protein